MSDGQCTTDALPSPPRDKKKYSRNDNKRKTELSESDDEKEEKFKDHLPPPPHNQAVFHVVHVTNSTGIHIGNNLIFNGKGTSSTNLGAPVIETEKIRSLKNSTKAVTTTDINIIAQHMCDGWKDTARKLDFSEGEIFQFEYKNKTTSLKETIYDLLNDWIEVKGPHKATVGVLTQTLWETKQRVAVEQWSKRYDKIHG